MELLTSYDSVNELKRFLDKNNFAMKKRFGQNFLVSPEAEEKSLMSWETMREIVYGR